MSRRGFLGIEAGGTRTIAIWQSEDARRSQAFQTGDANLQLIGDSTLVSRFRAIAGALPRPHAIAIGMAGARTERDRQRIRVMADRVWPGIPCVATHDLEVGLAAAELSLERRGSFEARIMVLSGTGSCCYGRTTAGRTARTGGWGHILGDEGSAFAIVHRALREVIRQFDETGDWSLLGANFLEALQLNEPDALIPWAQGASKGEIAALAPVVFAAASKRDAISRAALAAAAEALARTGVACARKLAKAEDRLAFVLAGSVLMRQRTFATAVGRQLRVRYPAALTITLDRPGAEGAVALARSLLTGPISVRHPPSLNEPRPSVAPSKIPAALRQSPTELRNPYSMRLDRLSPARAIDLALAEESRVAAALRAQKRNLVGALQIIGSRLAAGGRLFYVGAGTSGRLGILDASECPPTFGTPPELVQGIIAGGASAVFRAIEGTEDDFDAGASSLRFRRVRRRDVVVGIAASGRTPFVWGALSEARRRQASTILISFNPYLRFAQGQRPDVVITPRVGPEILTGSTRLKAGTATKLILNLFSTLTMVRLGKVVSNLMVDLNPANRKLRERAVRIVCELTPANEEQARHALEDSRWVVKQALRRLQH